MERKRIVFRSIIDPKSKHEIVGIYAKNGLVPLGQLPLFFFLKSDDNNNPENNPLSSLLSEQG